MHLFDAFLFATLTSFVASFSFAGPPPKKHSVVISQTVVAARNDCAERVLREVYKNIGVDLRFKLVPRKRALLESNSGRTDGETARVSGIEADYPNLVPIPVALCRVTFHIAYKAGLKISALKDLKGYEVGGVRGVLATTEMIQGIAEIREDSLQNLKKMFIRGRIQAVIVSNSSLSEFVSDKQLKDLVVVNLPDKTRHLFHYLHKKHSGLIADVTREMRRLESVGFIEQAIGEHETYAQEQQRRISP